MNRHEAAKRLLGYDGSKASERTMLLAMGRDAALGYLHYESTPRERLTADLDLFHLAPRYSESERLMADLSQSLGGELRTNPAWAFLGKPIATHNQGGCAMGDPDDGELADADGKPASAVLPDGRVRGQGGLFVLDGSILPRSVGVNPSSTIAAIAERCIHQFIESDGREDALLRGGYRAHLELVEKWKEKSHSWKLEPPLPKPLPINTPPLALEFKERMHGYYSEVDVDPGFKNREAENDARFLEAETRGRPHSPLSLDLTVRAENLTVFFEDLRHRLSVRGEVEMRLPGTNRVEHHEVNGTLDLFARRHKPYALREDHPDRGALARMGIPYHSRPGVPDLQRFLEYHLEFVTDGEQWVLDGYKRIRDDPGIDAWRDASHLYVRVFRGFEILGAGTVHVDLNGFLFKQLPSIQVGHVRDDELVPTEDASQAVWAAGKFGTFFFGTLQRIYVPEVQTALKTLFGPSADNVQLR
jgi:cholesterol oxidase